MPNKIYAPSFKLEMVTEEEIAESVGTDLIMFRGTAISNVLNSHFLTFSDEAKRTFAQAFSDGIGVFKDHITNADNRIGRTERGWISSGEVRVEFGINPAEQEFIQSLTSLGAELSPTFEPAIDGIVSDRSGLPFFPYWGGYYWIDENDEMLGDYVKTENGYEPITGTVTKIDRVPELSVVGNGSDPNTNVVRQMSQHKNMDAHFAASIAQMNGVNKSALINQIRLHRTDSPKPDKIDRTIFDLNPKKDDSGASGSNADDNKRGDKEMSVDMSKLLEMSNEDLVEQIKTLSAEKAELQAQIDISKTEEEFANLSKNATKLQADLDEANVKLANYDNLKEAMDYEISYWKLEAKSRKKVQMGYKDGDPRYTLYCQRTDAINDVAVLRSEALSSRTAYEATKLEDLPTMVIPLDKEEKTISSGSVN